MNGDFERTDKNIRKFAKYGLKKANVSLEMLDGE